MGGPQTPVGTQLCEKKLHQNSNFEIEGYTVKKSNLKAGKEGILIAAKQGTFCSMEVPYESDERNIATFEITYPKSILNLNDISQKGHLKPSLNINT